MSDRLRLLDSDLEAVHWDAHRNDDGAWLVTGVWRAGDKSGATRWTFDAPARIVTPYDAATTDFAEGTRLVRVVPDVPLGLATAPSQRSRPVSVLRDNKRSDGTAHATQDDDPPGPDDDGHSTDVLAPEVLGGDLPTPLAAGIPSGLSPEAEHVRDVHPPNGFADGDPSVESLLDEVAEHDTVVLARPDGDSDSDDPRVRIPAWEDIVFGVRRHR
jgi:hypothetical protein